MPVVYDHTDPRYIRHANNIWFRFNDKETQGTLHPSNWTTCYYEHIGGSAGVSTVVKIDRSEHLVDDNFISVVCEDVEAFVKHQTEELEYFSLITLDTYGDQKMLETNINRMCRCLENSLQSRTEKLKLKHLSLSVLEISQVVSAINLLDRDCLGIVTVRLPFEDQVFTAEDFIPLREGEKRQRFYLSIYLHKFSVEVLEEVRKLLAYASQFDFITINYETIDEKCIELLAEAKHSSHGKSVMFSIDYSDDPEEMARRIHGIDEECTIDLDEISKTEQWSKVKALQIKNLTVRMSIQEMNILNFEKIEITLETMSQEDIMYSRKASSSE
ncbi:hypothetical protein GCK72_021125 [Caenorhabditis remanei]|uniref:DUF38 domain-containing protein n=1 Tax=Caenorhabditis remanei TaxID=31234 RepID=A0A6A5GJ77_CAERE|nr:hypothetical protein GCK72_021125 [Caenorhabditis remanei]KAF1754562.1 hypothetical protein GCK72_021125 [Caenorhabditis remanei]